MNAKPENTNDAVQGSRARREAALLDILGEGEMTVGEINEATRDDDGYKWGEQNVYATAETLRLKGKLERARCFDRGRSRYVYFKPERALTGDIADLDKRISR